MALFNQAGQMISGAYDQIGHLGIAIANNMTNGYNNSNKQKQLKKQLMSSVKQLRNVLNYSSYDSNGIFIGNGAPNRISDPGFNALLRMLTRTANVKALPISSKLLFRGTPVVLNTGGIGPVGPAGPPSTVSRLVLDTTTAPIIMNMNNLPEVTFVGNSSIGAPKTWITFGTSVAILIPSIKFTMSTLDIQTFPSNFKMSQYDANWNDALKRWTPPDVGLYEASATYDGANWLLKIQGPF